MNRQSVLRAMLDIFVLSAPFLVMIAAVSVDLALFADTVHRMVFAPLLFMLLLLVQILLVRIIVVVLKKFL